MVLKINFNKAYDHVDWDFETLSWKRKASGEN